MKYNLFIALSCLLLISCADNAIYFDKTQPEGVENLTQMPFFYIGEYIDRDSNLLTISKNSIIRKNWSIYVFTQLEIDSSNYLKIENNFIVNTETNEKLNFKKVKDTFFIENINIDTMFLMSENNVARKYKGNLILNFRYNELWSVEIFSLKKRTLQQMSLNSKELFDKLSVISENEVITDSVSSDTLQMILKPTKKEFKDILEIKDSMVSHIYYKVR